jgi:hypothetical protein
MLIEVFSISYCLDDEIALTRQNEISVGFAFSRNVSAHKRNILEDRRAGNTFADAANYLCAAL